MVFFHTRFFFILLNCKLFSCRLVSHQPQPPPKFINFVNSFQFKLQIHGLHSQNAVESQCFAVQVQDLFQRLGFRKGCFQSKFHFFFVSIIIIFVEPSLQQDIHCCHLLSLSLSPSFSFVSYSFFSIFDDTEKIYKGANNCLRADDRKIYLFYKVSPF